MNELQYNYNSFSVPCQSFLVTIKPLDRNFSAKAEEGITMAIRKMTFYVILFVVMAICLFVCFYSFEPKTAEAVTSTKLITISADTTWDNITLDPSTGLRTTTPLGKLRNAER